MLPNDDEVNVSHLRPGQRSSTYIDCDCVAQNERAQYKTVARVQIQGFLEEEDDGKIEYRKNREVAARKPFPTSRQM